MYLTGMQIKTKKTTDKNEALFVQFDIEKFISQ